MDRVKYLILLLLLPYTFQVYGQSSIPDSLRLERFPFVIGNIGFATDSIDIVIGDVPSGEVSTFSIGLYNYGKEPVEFISGKSNRFVDLDFEPPLILPSGEGIMNVEFEADPEIPLGEFDVEISITSNDIQNPAKFLYLLMNIVENTSGIDRRRLDTVPQIVFDHYNYEYGHLARGGKQYHTFVVSNSGSQPLIIYDIDVPKGIKVVDRPYTAIDAGEETILRVLINTKGRVGVQHQSLLVHSNDPKNPLIILGLHGSVKVYPSHKKTSDQCNENRQRF